MSVELETRVRPSNQRWKEIERLLDLALERPVDERRAFLEQACAHDPALLEGVSRLLRSSERPEAWLDGQAPSYAAPLMAEAEMDPATEGARIGPYRIVSEAGHGGMGTVYLAERDEPYHQRVALKVVRGGFAPDDHLVRRFVEERQILASLEHPRIARLLDGGITAEGLPWFALEYVEGIPIDRYLELHRQSLEARIELFLAVCDAVQYAHRHLVVHRDLKPSNILVTDDAQVKLLDFGIAKLVAGGQDAETGTALRLMTPEYASPEQVRGEPVTVASDVYSLGVLLYELLTSRRLYRLTPAAPLELERAVLEQEPERPSRTVADARLRRRLGGDLDTIVLTALRKEPARRYPTVDALAEDLHRHRTGLPVRARQDSVSYRLGKFARRHRAGVAAGIAVLLSLIVGLAGTAWQAREASREAAKAREVKDFVIGIFRSSDPAQSRGRDVSARELLERGSRRIDSVLVAQPDLRAELLSVLGDIHMELGLLDRADTLLREALALSRSQSGVSSPEVASNLTSLGRTLWAKGAYDEADTILTEALALHQRLSGLDHPLTARAAADLAAVHTTKGSYQRAESLLREALAIDRRYYGDRHPVVAEDLVHLGVMLEAAGNLASSDTALQSAIAIYERLDREHPDAVMARHYLSRNLRTAGKFAEAESLGTEVLAQLRRLYPAGHYSVLYALDHLAATATAQGRTVEAEARISEALEMSGTLLGPDHPETITLVGDLAMARRSLGKLAAAEAGARQAWAAYRRTVGPEHPWTLTTLSNLAVVISDRGNHAAAESALAEVLSARRRVLGNAHPDVAHVLAWLGEVRYRRGRHAEAEVSSREAVAINRKALPAGHPELSRGLRILGKVLCAGGETEEGERTLRQALESDPQSAHSQRELGACLAKRGQFAEAEALLLESFRRLGLSQDNWFARQGRIQTARTLADLYLTWGTPEKAARYRRFTAEDPGSASP